MMDIVCMQNSKNYRIIYLLKIIYDIYYMDWISIILIIIILIILVIFVHDVYSVEGYKNTSIRENIDESIEESIKDPRPKLWIYWENKKDEQMPSYIKLCQDSIYRHCSDSFNIIKLDEKNIYDYLPELKEKNLNLSKLLIAQKVDYYRVLLLQKFGGLYLDLDIIVLNDPIEITDKLKDYDYVGFGCTGNKCSYGYGKPSNGIMASRANGKLMTNVLKNIESKLQNNKGKKWDYFDLGKLVIWEEIDKLSKSENYKYYHYSNDYDGTRDIHGHWVNTPVLFSNMNLVYKHPEKMIFLVMYNSGMDQYKKMSEYELLNSDMNISKFFRRAVLE